MKILLCFLFLAATQYPGIVINCEIRQSSLENNELSIRLEKEFWLTVLGMKEEPMNITKPTVEKRSAPVYLMNIYSSVVDKLVFNYTIYDLTNDDYHKANNSDTLVSFLAHHKTTRHTLRRIWFDVITNNTHIDHKENLTNADLRLYRDNSLTLDRYRGLPFNLTIYRFYKGNLYYVNSKIIDADYQGWVVVNITTCFQWWIDNPRLNNGLRLKITPITESGTAREIQAESIGLVGFDGEPDKFAFIVGYFKSSFNDSTFLKNQKCKRSLISELNILEQQVVMDRKDSCQLRGMYVDFRKIGYWDWIIAPEGVEAMDCIGRCEFPFGDDFNVKVQGFLKALIELHSVSKIMKVRCRPIKYSAGNTLYWSAEDKVTYRVIPQLSASACGCR